MFSRRCSSIIAVTLVLMVTAPTLAFRDNGVMWQAFQDYLQGRSVALLNVNIIPVDESGSAVAGNFMVVVHNFTEYSARPHSTIDYTGRSPFTLRIWRTPWRYGVPAWGGDARVIYSEHEYTITVYSMDFSWHGGRSIRVEPVTPSLDLTVRIIVNPIEEEKRPIPQASEASDQIRPLWGYLEEVAYTTELHQALQLHSIQGISVSARFRIGNYLYYTQKYRQDWGFGWGGWMSAGDEQISCNTDADSDQISTGEKRWVRTYVDYRYERWRYEYWWDGEYVVWWEEWVTPVQFGSWAWGDSITCDRCGGSVSGWYRGINNSPQAIALGLGVNQIEEWGLAVHFSVSYGPVTLEVELWKKISQGTSGYPPAIVVTVNSWEADTLYAFDDGSEWKIVHFTWTPP